MRLWMPALLVPAWPKGLRFFSGERFQPAEQILLARHAGDLVSELAVFEKQEGWNRADLVLKGKTLIFVYVYFCDLDRIGLFPGNFVEQRGDELARSAPFCPKVYQHRLIAVDFTIKI